MRLICRVTGWLPLFNFNNVMKKHSKFQMLWFFFFSFGLGSWCFELPRCFSHDSGSSCLQWEGKPKFMAGLHNLFKPGPLKKINILLPMCLQNIYSLKSVCTQKSWIKTSKQASGTTWHEMIRFGRSTEEFTARCCTRNSGFLFNF